MHPGADLVPRKKTDENKQNWADEPPEKAHFSSFLKGESMNPLFGFVWDVVFNTPQVVNLGTTYLGNSGLSVYQMRLNDHLWQQTATLSPFTQICSSAAH